MYTEPNQFSDCYYMGKFAAKRLSGISVSADELYESSLRDIQSNGIVAITELTHNPELYRAAYIAGYNDALLPERTVKTVTFTVIEYGYKLSAQYGVTGETVFYTELDAQRYLNNIRARNIAGYIAVGFAEYPVNVWLKIQRNIGA